MSGEQAKTKAEVEADRQRSLRAALETIARGVALEPSERSMLADQLDEYFGPVEAPEVVEEDA